MYDCFGINFVVSALMDITLTLMRLSMLIRVFGFSFNWVLINQRIDGN